jgi:RNA polymerase sigma-70 factor (ECF subfamily)
LLTAPATAHDAALGPSPEVLRVLVENHERFLGFLERRVGRRELAEEILQEAFVRSIVRGAALRDEESAVAWFYRLLRNALVDHHRRDAAHQRALDALAEDPTTGPAASEPDQELIDAICACVNDLVGTLKPEYAEAIRRVDLGGTSVQAFAGEAAITAGNAAVRLYRARQALRRRVEESCGACATHGCYQCQCRDEHPAASITPAAGTRTGR